MSQTHDAVIRRAIASLSKSPPHVLVPSDTNPTRFREKVIRDLEALRLSGNFYKYFEAAGIFEEITDLIPSKTYMTIIGEYIESTRSLQAISAFWEDESKVLRSASAYERQIDKLIESRPDIKEGVLHEIITQVMPRFRFWYAAVGFYLKWYEIRPAAKTESTLNTYEQQQERWRIQKQQQRERAREAAGIIADDPEVTQLLRTVTPTLKRMESIYDKIKKLTAELHELNESNLDSIHALADFNTESLNSKQKESIANSLQLWSKTRP